MELVFTLIFNYKFELPQLANSFALYRILHCIVQKHETFVIDSLFDFNASSVQTIALTMNCIHVVTCMSEMTEGMGKSNEFDSLRLAEWYLKKNIGVLKVTIKKEQHQRKKFLVDYVDSVIMAQWPRLDYMKNGAKMLPFALVSFCFECIDQLE